MAEITGAGGPGAAVLEGGAPRVEGITPQIRVGPEAGAPLSGPKIDTGAVLNTAKQPGGNEAALHQIAGDAYSGELGEPQQNTGQEASPGPTERSQPGLEGQAQVPPSAEVQDQQKPGEPPLVEATPEGVVGEATETAVQAAEGSAQNTNVDTTPQAYNQRIDQLAQDTPRAELEARAAAGEPDAKAALERQQSQTETQTPQTTATPEAAGDNNASDSSAEKDAKNARRQELEAKNPRDLTVDDIRELNDLRQDPELKKQNRLNELQEKLDNGDLTDPKEQEELVNLYRGEDENSTDTELTTEQRLAELDKKIQDLDAGLMDRLAKGELSGEDITDLTEQLQNLRQEHTSLQNGFTPEETRAMVKEAVTRGTRSTRGKERKIRAAEDVKEKLQELMTIEMQILSLPKQADALNETRKKAVDKVRAAHTDTKSKSDPQAHAEALNTEVQAMLELNNVNTQLIQLKNAAWTLRGRQAVLMAQVRSQLGVHGALRSFVELTGAHTQEIFKNVVASTMDNFNYSTGSFN